MPTNKSISYFFTYKSTIKGRWEKRSILDVMSDEFHARTRKYYEDAIFYGAIKVNGQKVHPDYILSPNDILEHTVHIHEPMPGPIEIIAEENDYLVINKSAGMPCHPTTEYNHYSITRIIENQYNHKKLACINRLDVPTSGILIVAFNNYEYYHSLMRDRNVKKIYIAKVEGKFPEEISVDGKIKNMAGKYNIIAEDGKASLTIFQRISYNGNYSIVECHPMTGRSHQIRVHLQSIGFPIVNDYLYGSGITCKEEFQKCDFNDFKGDNEMEKFVIANCKGENNRAFRNKNSFLCLHAYKYYFNGKEYVAPLPDWAFIE
ncbi:Bifunctional protein RIB2 [Astathelohania contejeani]|uniref:Pseudouridine synthase n=1 Tax=Astathelohania contejeani TaxID=164912 RepID=A0ABQ7I2B9_9MICR|nr:Bifunctional protein RIB2 [Thelohania contejeani]